VNDFTQILKRIDDGDPAAPEQFLPLVYDELRRLAAGHMANESPGHTLDATALVHEAYLRLVGLEDKEIRFANRGHFFAAAAEAMRRILVDAARRKRAAKRGGGRRVELPSDVPAELGDADSWIDLDAALSAFEDVDPAAAKLAKLRIFGGLTNEEAGEGLGAPRATAHRQWTYAKAWLTAALADRAEVS